MVAPTCSAALWMRSCTTTRARLLVSSPRVSTPAASSLWATRPTSPRRSPRRPASSVPSVFSTTPSPPVASSPLRSLSRSALSAVTTTSTCSAAPGSIAWQRRTSFWRLSAPLWRPRTRRRSSRLVWHSWVPSRNVSTTSTTCCSRPTTARRTSALCPSPTTRPLTSRPPPMMSWTSTNASRAPSWTSPSSAWSTRKSSK
mmetsp:Transcript_15294/g.36093  ORF Transcript_15294/g.36093 Transcript_15294/m.36093 type:complete len:200 (+) Transcript_15294:940-1539(+)